MIEKEKEYQSPRSWSLAGGLTIAVAITLVIGLIITARPVAPKVSNQTVEDLSAERARRPTDADTSVRYAHALKESGDVEGAYRVMKDVVERNPQSTQYLSRLAQYAAMNGHAVETVGLYRHVLGMNPNDADAHIELGHILFDAGLLTDAVQEYDAGVRLNQKVSRDPSIYAKCLEHVGRDEEAWNELNYYFAHQPHMDEAYDTLTDIGIRLKRFDETEHLLLRRISIESEYNVNRFEYDIARVILARPHGPSTLADAETFADAGAYSRMGKYQDIPDEPTPNEAKWFALYGNILRQESRLDEAQTTLTDGLYLDPFNPDCLKELADLCASRNDPKAAAWRRTYNMAIRMNGELSELNSKIAAHPSDPAPLLALCAYLEKQQEFGAAAEICIKAVALQPGNKKTQDELARYRELAIKKLETDAAE